MILRKFVSRMFDVVSSIIVIVSLLMMRLLCRVLSFCDLVDLCCDRF